MSTKRSKDLCSLEKFVYKGNMQQQLVMHAARSLKQCNNVIEMGVLPRLRPCEQMGHLLNWDSCIDIPWLGSSSSSTTWKCLDLRPLLTKLLCLGHQCSNLLPFV